MHIYYAISILLISTATVEAVGKNKRHHKKYSETFSSSTEKDSLAIDFLRGKKGSEKALFQSKETFRKRGSLFKQLHRARDPVAQLKRVIKAITQGKAYKSLDKKRAQGMFGMLKEEELEEIADIKGGCATIGTYLAFLDNKTLSKISKQSCISSMIEGATRANRQGEFISNIPADWVNAKVVELISPALNYASPSFIKALNNHEEYAKYVKPKTLAKMNKSQLGNFAADFVARIPALLEVEIPKAIPLMPDDAFSSYRGKVDPKNAKALRRVQVQKFNSKNPEIRCSKLPLARLTSEQFGGVDGGCVLSYLKQREPAPLGRSWALLKKDWLDGVPEEFFKALKHIDDKDKKFIPAATWDAMLKNTQVCENLCGNGQFSADQQISAGGECFAKLKDIGLMTKILLNPDVSEDIFAFVDKKTINRIETKISGKEISGFQIIPYMKAISSRKETIISLISTQMTSGTHACAAIENVDIIHRAKEFSAASPDCFAAIRATVTEDDYIKSPCLLNALEPSEAVKAYSGKWSTITQTALTSLLKRGATSEITQDIFLQLNKDALPAFTAEYVIQIDYLKNVPKERLVRLADDAYAQFDGERFAAASLDWEKVTDKQLPHVSVKVSHPNKRVTAQLNAAAVKSFGSRFAKFSALQLEAVSADAWSAVSEQVFPEISHEALSRITASQLTKVGEKVLITLTPKQAEFIGKEVEAKDSPLQIYMELLPKLGANTQTVIKSRIATKMSAKSSAANPLISSKMSLFLGTATIFAILL